MSRKEREHLKPLSFHGHKLEDVLSAFLKVKPEKKDDKKREKHDK